MAYRSRSHRHPAHLRPRASPGIAALRVLDPEWSVDSPPPWSSLDVICWMLLWLLPAWVPALLLPAGAVARRRAFRRAKLLLELEGALSEIEVEQKQSRFDEPEVAGRSPGKMARFHASASGPRSRPLASTLVALAAVLPLALARRAARSGSPREPRGGTGYLSRV